MSDRESQVAHIYHDHITADTAVRADGPTREARPGTGRPSLVEPRTVNLLYMRPLRPTGAYYTCMVHGIIHLVSQTHRPHARTDLQDLSHNTQEEVLASSAEQVRSFTPPLDDTAAGI